MYRSFAWGALALLATLGWVALDDRRSEWRGIQEAHAALVASRAEAGQAAAPVRIGLRQAYLPALGAVDRCASCHLGLDDAALLGAPPPHGAHPGAWLETHPPERFGCTACHGGNGRATTFAAAGHRPGPDVLDPMVSPVAREARCGVCHRGLEVPGAPVLSEGRRLLHDKGCATCHDIPGVRQERPFGEAIDDVGSKTDGDFLTRWLRDPEKLRPRTKMPRFRLDDERIRTLVSFLLSLKVPDLEDARPLEEGDPEAGRSLFGQARCTTCHTYKGKGGTVGPPLDRVGEDLQPRWLVAWLRDPHRLDPETLMPRYEFTRQQALDLAAWLLEEMVSDEPHPRAPAPPATPEAVAAGQALFQELGCADCHKRVGLARTGQSAPTLRGFAGRSPELLGFAHLPAGTNRTLADWIYRKIERPEAGFPESRMPSFRLEGPEIAALTVAILSLKEVPWPAEYVRAAAPLRRYDPPGEFGALVRRYRCLSCHRIQGDGGDVSRVPLDREGSRVQPAWLEEFLLLPDTIRVAQEERMPKLGMGREDARRLATVLSEVFRDDRIPLEAPPAAAAPDAAERGARLFDELGCRACHIQGGRGGYVGPDLARTGVRLRSGWVYALLEDPALLRPEVVHPDHGLTEGDAAALTAFLMAQRPAPPPAPGPAPEEVAP